MNEREFTQKQAERMYAVLKTLSSPTLLEYYHLPAVHPDIQSSIRATLAAIDTAAPVQAECDRLNSEKEAE